MPFKNRTLLIVLPALLLVGCDLLGLGPDPRIAQREADAKAIGGACRHGLRSIEDCYTLNKGIAKSSIWTNTCGKTSSKAYALRFNQHRPQHQPHLRKKSSRNQKPRPRRADSRPCLASDAQVKHRHAFHMRGVREHVHHPGSRTKVACLVHQQTRISGQSRRIATHVHNAFGWLPVA